MKRSPFPLLLTHGCIFSAWRSSKRNVWSRGLYNVLKSVYVMLILWWMRLIFCSKFCAHYNDVIMGAMAFQTIPAIVYTAVYTGADQRKHKSSAPLAFVRGIWPVNSPHKGPVTRQILQVHDVIMTTISIWIVKNNFIFLIMYLHIY